MSPLSSRDGISWHPVSVIEKYSPDQVRYAREWQAWAATRRLALVPELHGAVLRALFREPECGTVHDEGNGVTAGGMGNLALVLTGTGGHPLAPGRAVFGVGSDATAFDREHVHLSRALGEEPGRSWYRPMDHGYPLVPRPGVIEVQATFTESEACFDWHEWCTAAGPVTPVPHHALSGAYRGAPHLMMNRKAHAAGYGEKFPGVAWCFRTEISIG